jgi:hypothetical protein
MAQSAAKVATRIIEALPVGAAQALSVLLMHADATLETETRAVLPEGTAARFKKSPVAQARLAALCAQSEKDQAAFASDSRVTVLRALAKNPTLHATHRDKLCHSAFRLDDDELMANLLWCARGDVVVRCRAAFPRSTGTLAPHLFAFTEKIAERNDPEEILHVLAHADVDIAGPLLALVAAGKSPAVTLRDAKHVSPSWTETLKHSQATISRVTLEYAEEIVKAGVFNMLNRERHWSFSRSATHFDEGTPQVLSAVENKWLLAASLATGFIAVCDIEFVAKNVLGALVVNNQSKNNHEGESYLNGFARRHAKNASPEVLSEVTALYAAVGASSYKMMSAWDSLAQELLPVAPSVQRLECLPRCSAGFIANWLLEGAPHVSDDDDASLYFPRDSEVLALLKAMDDDRRNSVALILANKCEPTSSTHSNGGWPAWWAEVADGLEGLFFQTSSKSFAAYATTRLFDAVGDDAQAWQMVLQTWPSYHGSLTDLCLLAELSMENPPVREVLASDSPSSVVQQTLF